MRMIAGRHEVMSTGPSCFGISPAILAGLTSCCALEKPKDCVTQSVQIPDYSGIRL